MGRVDERINFESKPSTKKKPRTMSTEQQKSSGCGLLVGTAVVAGGAAAWYFHKDMSKDELKEAGQRYVAKTKEVSIHAYETAKPYAVLAAEKTAEASKSAYQKLMDYLYPEAESEVDAAAFAEPETDAEEEVNAESEVESEEL